METISIILTVKDRLGLVSEVMKILSDFNIMVYNHRADVYQDNCKHIKLATFRLTLETLPQDRLILLLKKFSRLKGYVSADLV